MAGKPGRSGGARPGAGRKPTPPVENPNDDPLSFLIGVMNGSIPASPTQVQAGVAAARIVYGAPGTLGKKEQQAEAAKTVAGGKFKPTAPPLKLVGNG